MATFERYGFTSGQKAMALGRNGVMKCVGVEVSDMTFDRESDAVSIAPMNSRGIGRCWIEVPKADIDKLICLLRKFKEDDA